eukprot:gnl/MRDRNA2_/MRDRNA2_186909_c0_seq1.p1 gnl/MRDRNA2_/MRDRNA2_186909_c0~~gnl/MRDRNA2_/MRDRNA2_186909_c0_seq1.p1  ORF type:complete len:614 (+),score=79.03 gnl/MRDRNA2_/MRDRNA2_186909_c0_seq1:3-1844(+)
MQAYNVMQQQVQRTVSEKFEHQQSRLPLHPCCSLRLAWDVASLLLIFYDMCMIPFNLSFSLGKDFAWTVIDRIILAFWCVDIGFNFITGYFQDGELNMSWLEICRHYVNGWLLPDVVIVSIDLVLVFLGSEHNAEVSSLKLLRMLRMIRLVRLLKMQSIFRALEDYLTSYKLTLMLEVVKFVILLLVKCHFIACGWHAVGNLPDEVGWVEFHGFQNASLEYRYAGSMLWTLAQFTFATTEVYPHNVIECIFAICILILGQILVFVSLASFTASMLHTQMSELESNENVQKLRQIMDSRGVNERLSAEIEQGFQHHIAGRREQDREAESSGIISLLPAHLKTKLEVGGDLQLIGNHPFFRQLISDNALLAHKLCSLTMRHFILHRASCLFEQCTVTNKMFFIAKGRMKIELPAVEPNAPQAPQYETSLRSQYTFIPDSFRSFRKSMTLTRSFRHSMTFSSFTPSLKKNHAGRSQEYHLDGSLSDCCKWLAEASLWVPWVHTCTVSAISNCDLISIDACEFADLIVQDQTYWLNSSQYATLFIEWLNDQAKFCQHGGLDLGPPQGTLAAAAQPLSRAGHDEAEGSQPETDPGNMQKVVETFDSGRKIIEPCVSEA